MVKVKNLVLVLTMCFVLSGLAAVEHPDVEGTLNTTNYFYLD